MAALFTNPHILANLRREANNPIYTFVEIGVSSDVFPDGIYLTSFPEDILPTGLITVPRKDGSFPRWTSDLLEGVSAPSRTGGITQEIQKLEIAQGLSYQYSDAYKDILTALGGSYHNAPVRVSIYVQDPNTQQMILNEPISRSNGIIKSVSRSIRSESIIIEFSNSFGKLDGLNELRTTSGSIHRRDKADTCFEKAAKVADRVALEWGT